MYLLDTNVVSALRLSDRNRVVRDWIAPLDPAGFFISTATIAEIELGAERQHKKNPDYARTLSKWLDGLIVQFNERILSIDVAVARRWGAITAAMGHPDLDFAIAATALEHDLIVVTRNVSDFIKTGAAIYDPFENKSYGRGKA